MRNAKQSRRSSHLVIEKLVKVYGGSKAVDEISLDVAPGEILALLGPSGCGKTTLLKMIAGLTDPTAGNILVDSMSILSLPTHKRALGMLFQNYALFPHLNVMANVAFGLEMRRTPRAEIERRCREALDRVQLGAFSKRMPRELSGGQQQRIALARAIVYEPDILLLDEPLAALDKNLREGMQMELRALCKQLNLTTVLVTHDQDEAMTLADKIAILRSGRLEQVGSAREVYERPINRFVADFIGTSNFFSGTVHSRSGDTVSIRTASGLNMLARADRIPETWQDASALFAVRPEAIRLDQSSPAEVNSVRGVVDQVLFRGAQVTTVITTQDGIKLICSDSAQEMLRVPAEGEQWTASWSPERAILVHDS